MVKHNCALTTTAKVSVLLLPIQEDTQVLTFTASNYHLCRPSYRLYYYWRASHNKDTVLAVTNKYITYSNFAKVATSNAVSHAKVRPDHDCIG